MLEGSNAARREPGQDRAAAAARQFGPILLVAAAIFLVVFVLCRTPLQGYVLSQRVQASADRVTNVPPLAIEQVVAWLRADAVLASTVQQACPRDSLAAQNNLIQELRAGLKIQPQGTAVDRPGWQLNLQHRDRQLASRLLTRLSESLTEQLKHLDQAETQLLVQHYQKQLTEARSEEDSARLTLERARQEQITAAMQAGEPKLPPRIARQLSTSTAKSPREELEQQMQLAKSRLEQLLSIRTAEHPQVIEAQAQLTRLQGLLDQLPAEDRRAEQPAEEPAPALRGPELPTAAAKVARPRVQLVSNSGEPVALQTQSSAIQLHHLSSQWSAAAARRSELERSLADAQQQWVRVQNSAGWEASAVWTQSQFGGHTTPFQLLLAGSLALIGAVGAWRLTWVALSRGTLGSLLEVNEALPLPVLGTVPLSIRVPVKSAENWQLILSRLVQLSLAVVAAVILVAVWASGTDNNLSTLWSSDPLSALGQAFDMLHHRVVG